jgi:hypothetical protein
MRIKFIGKNVTETIRTKYPDNQILIDHDFHLDIGETYLVVAIYINKKNGIIIDCINKYGQIGYYPIDFFEITDSRVSKYWVMKIKENGDITFYPKEYYENEFFHDDLSEDIPEVVEQFHDLVKRFKEEFD